MGDVNGATQSGFMLPHGTLRDGLRCSTAKAFIRPAVHRRNLHISLLTQVEKVLIRRRKKEAYGVVLNKAGMGVERVYATKEVILSAGSIQSPQLLMLSGVGPKEHLESLNIPVVYDSPGVGSNLQVGSSNCVAFHERNYELCVNLTGPYIHGWQFLPDR